MSVGTFTDGVLAGLALFLLGAWLAQEGTASAAGALVRRVLSQRVKLRRHAWSLGALLGLGMPLSDTSARAVAGLVNTGSIGLRLSLWAAAGHGAGVVGLALLFALFSDTNVAGAIALALVAGGVAAIWSAPDRTLGDIGRALAGWGLLLLGMTLLAEGMEHGRGALQLDGLAGGLLVRALVLGVVGAAFAVALRSSGASVVLAASAAGAGLITLHSGLAMSLGAAVACSAGPLLAFDRLTPAARRSALGLAAVQGAVLLVGCVLLACSLPILSALPEPLARPGWLVALLLSLSLGGAAMALSAFDWHLVRLLESRFLSEEQDPTVAQHVDGSLAGLPELALEALQGEASRLSAVSRRLGAAVLAREGLTERRESDDRETLQALSQVLEDAAAALTRRALSPRVATALPNVLRAVQASWELAEQSVYLNAGGLAGAGPLGAGLEARMLRLQLDLGRLLESADATSRELSPEGLEVQLSSLEQRILELRGHAVARGAEGALDPAGLERTIEKLSTLRRIAHLAVDSALDLARSLPADDASAADTDEARPAASEAPLAAA